MQGFQLSSPVKSGGYYSPGIDVWQYMEYCQLRKLTQPWCPESFAGAQSFKSSWLPLWSASTSSPSGGQAGWPKAPTLHNIIGMAQRPTLDHRVTIWLPKVLRQIKSPVPHDIVRDYLPEAESKGQVSN